MEDKSTPDASLVSIMSHLTLEYNPGIDQIVPKWKKFTRGKHSTLHVFEKKRLDNAIWRAWYLWRVKKVTTPYVNFNQDKFALEAKYYQQNHPERWKKRLLNITSEYAVWRSFCKSETYRRLHHDTLKARNHREESSNFENIYTSQNQKQWDGILGPGTTSSPSSGSVSYDSTSYGPIFSSINNVSDQTTFLLDHLANVPSNQDMLSTLLDDPNGPSSTSFDTFFDLVRDDSSAASDATMHELYMDFPDTLFSSLGAPGSEEMQIENFRSIDTSVSSDVSQPRLDQFMRLGNNVLPAFAPDQWINLIQPIRFSQNYEESEQVRFSSENLISADPVLTGTISNTKVRPEIHRKLANKPGFDDLQALLPTSARNLPQTKLSKAGVLQKTIEYILLLHKQRDELVEEAHKLRKDILALKFSLNQYQQHFPSFQPSSLSGSPIKLTTESTDPVVKLYQNYLQTHPPSQVKFWIFGRIMDRFFATFNSRVSVTNSVTAKESSLAWVERDCKISQWREYASAVIRTVNFK